MNDRVYRNSARPFQRAQAHGPFRRLRRAQLQDDVRAVAPESGEERLTSPGGPDPEAPRVRVSGLHHLPERRFIRAAGALGSPDLMRNIQSAEQAASGLVDPGAAEASGGSGRTTRALKAEAGLSPHAVRVRFPLAH